MEKMRYMNGVRRSGINGGQAIFFALFLFPIDAGAGDLTIWTEPKTALIFAGENKTVDLYLKNSANVARKIKVETRIFEVAKATTVALGERKKWKEISLEAGQTRVEKFPLALSQIRATTMFVLKFYEEGNVVEIGSAPLLIYPEDMLSEIKHSQKNLLAALVK
jgi:hypothetical protein